MQLKNKEILKDGIETPEGIVMPAAKEPIYDNYTPGAEHPKNADARGGYGDRDGKEGFGTDSGTGLSAISMNESKKDTDAGSPNTQNGHMGDGLPSNADIARDNSNNSESVDDYSDLDDTEVNKQVTNKEASEEGPII